MGEAGGVCLAVNGSTGDRKGFTSGNLCAGSSLVDGQATGGSLILGVLSCIVDVVAAIAVHIHRLYSAAVLIGCCDTVNVAVHCSQSLLQILEPGFAAVVVERLVAYPPLVNRQSRLADLHGVDVLHVLLPGKCVHDHVPGIVCVSQNLRNSRIILVGHTNIDLIGTGAAKLIEGIIGNLQVETGPIIITGGVICIAKLHPTVTIFFMNCLRRKPLQRVKVTGNFRKTQIAPALLRREIFYAKAGLHCTSDFGIVLML